MPGRIFTEPERKRLDAFPSEIGEADLIRYFTLSRSDLDLVRRQRGDHNRIGFALQLCALRYMGFSPDNLEIVSTMAVAFVAEQLQVSPAALRDYGARSQTRTEHLQQIRLRLGFRDATREDFSALADWLLTRALEHDKPSLLFQLACEHLYRGEATGSIRLHDLQLDYVRAQHPDWEGLALLHAALRLSSHVIARDPAQFASQMVGRLLAYVQSEESIPAVQQFTSSVVRAAPRPWLRSLQPALYPPGTGLVRTLVGHSDGVWGVAVSEDGRRAVSTSYDNTLKVWDLETGRELRTLAGDFSFYETDNSVAVSGDGRRALSATSFTLMVWNLETGRELRIEHGHLSPDPLQGVSCLAMSEDGRRALSAAAGDQRLKVWDLETGRELRTLNGHSRGINSVALSGDGRCLLHLGTIC